MESSVHLSSTPDVLTTKMVRRTDPLFEWFGSASRRVRHLRQSRVPSASRPVARQRATTHESLEKYLNGAEWGGTETSGDAKPATLIRHVRRKHRACLFTHYMCYSTPNVLTKMVRRTDPFFFSGLEAHRASSPAPAQGCMVPGTLSASRLALPHPTLRRQPFTPRNSRVRLQRR